MVSSLQPASHTRGKRTGPYGQSPRAASVRRSKSTARLVQTASCCPPPFPVRYCLKINKVRGSAGAPLVPRGATGRPPISTFAAVNLEKFFTAFDVAIAHWLERFSGCGGSQRRLLCFSCLQRFRLVRIPRLYMTNSHTGLLSFLLPPMVLLNLAGFQHLSTAPKSGVACLLLCTAYALVFARRPNSACRVLDASGQLVGAFVH